MEDVQYSSATPQNTEPEYLLQRLLLEGNLFLHVIRTQTKKKKKIATLTLIEK